jgi:hypothetical protein
MKKQLSTFTLLMIQGHGASCHQLEMCQCAALPMLSTLAGSPSFKVDALKCTPNLNSTLSKRKNVLECANLNPFKSLAF